MLVMPASSEHTCVRALKTMARCSQPGSVPVDAVAVAAASASASGSNDGGIEVRGRLLSPPACHAGYVSYGATYLDGC